MSKNYIYIKNLVSIIPLQNFRTTPKVKFFNIKLLFDKLSAIDYVIHHGKTYSPQLNNNSKHFWYMHTDQKDHLIVHQGIRIVELYSIKHGKIEIFEVSPEYIKHNGKIIYTGYALLSWPPYVFHRITSPSGSISTNYAYHYIKFNKKSNFNIYDLNINTGKYSVVRDGYLDEK